MAYVQTGVLSMEGKFNFFSFNKKSDWDRGMSVNITVSDQGLKLNSSPRYGLERTIGREELPVIARLSDFAAGKFSLLYLLDDHANLLVYDLQNQHLDYLFQAGHGLFTGEAQIASTGEMICVADARGEHRLMAFSLANGQMLWGVDAVGDQPINPLALFMDHAQSTYVLTRYTSENGPEVIQKLALLKILNSGFLGAADKTIEQAMGGPSPNKSLTGTSEYLPYDDLHISFTLDYSPEQKGPAVNLVTLYGNQQVGPVDLAMSVPDIKKVLGKPMKSFRSHDLSVLEYVVNEGIVDFYYDPGTNSVQYAEVTGPAPVPAASPDTAEN